MFDSAHELRDFILENEDDIFNRCYEAAKLLVPDVSGKDYVYAENVSIACLAALLSALADIPIEAGTAVNRQQVINLIAAGATKIKQENNRLVAA